MNTTTQLSTQIRFHLETLAETNAHHPFEQLCLGLTRRRIVINVIPATGPVAAGGDGGRDAETFWSVLARELPDTSLFTSLATDESVVLAVTAQRKGVPAKIRSDLSKICGGGEPVDRVVYFSIAPVDTAKRHELQAHARRQHSIALEIWDAQAIANEIADPDLFYLAVDYLHVPSSLAPERDETGANLPDWYVAARDRQRSRSSHSGSTGEYVDLREGLRYASLNTEARADLPDWLSSARALRSAASGDASVENRIDYEIIVATGFGLDTLKPVDDILRGFFERIVRSPPDAGVLVDAITLIHLTQVTLSRGATTIGAEEAGRWADDLEQLFASELSAASGANARVNLLAAATILAFAPRSFTAEELAEAPAPGPKMSEIYQELNAAKREGRPMPAAVSADRMRGVDAGMAHLVTLVTELPNAPMAALEQLMSFFDLTAPALVDHVDYVLVREALDAVTIERSGLAVVGDRAQDRAIALVGAGRPLDALREIHAAKLSWLNGDTVEGAAIMMLLASRVYSELGLPLAAKQYAMSAASLAKGSNDPELAVIIARGLILTASYEQQAGQWLTATRTFRIGIWAQAELAGDPWSFERYPYFQDMLIDQCFILRAAKSLRPQLLPEIEGVVASTKLDELTGPMLATVDGLDPMDEDETADSADRSGMGRPFSDAGTTREYCWGALGNVWIVTTKNERAHVLAGERFVAALQIMIADLAAEDLLLMPGEVRVEITISDGPVPQYSVFVPEADRGARADGHLVLLTSSGVLTADADQLEVASAALQTIATHSLLSRSAFEGVMSRTFQRGLPHMLTCVRPYDELVDIHKDEFFVELTTLSGGSIGHTRPRSPRQADGLRTELSEHAAMYDHAASISAITARYEMLLPPVRLTVARLAGDPEFTRLVEALRVAGWKDWHLLTAIANIAVNARAVRSGLNMTTSATQSEMARFRRLMQSEERPDDPETPVSLFTEDAMWFHLASAAVTTAQRWGLELRLTHFDPRMFLGLLGTRFNYWADDIDHPPLLG